MGQSQQFFAGKQFFIEIQLIQHLKGSFHPVKGVFVHQIRKIKAFAVKVNQQTAAPEQILKFFQDGCFLRGTLAEPLLQEPLASVRENGPQQVEMGISPGKTGGLDIEKNRPVRIREPFPGIWGQRIGNLLLKDVHGYLLSSCFSLWLSV